MSRYYRRKKDHYNQIDLSDLYKLLLLLLLFLFPYFTKLYKENKTLFFIILGAIIILAMLYMLFMKKRKEKKKALELQSKYEFEYKIKRASDIVNNDRNNNFYKESRNDEKGEFNELKIYEKLNDLDIYSKVIRDVYIPCDDGNMSQIDVILITNRGIFVIESKNFDGKIYCYEGKNWIYRKNKHYKLDIYNPILQNNIHIKNLSKYLNIDNKDLYSIICFGKKSILKNVEKIKGNFKIANINHIERLVKDMYNSKKNIYTNEDIDSIYEKLKSCKDVDNTMKLKHIENIKNGLNKENKYKILIFDLDDTLIDNKENIRHAFKKMIELENVIYSDSEFERWYTIDNNFWRARQDNLIEIPDEFKDEIGKKSEAFTNWIRAQRVLIYFKNNISLERAIYLNNIYMNALMDEVIEVSGAYEILKYLSSKYKIIIATNGPSVAAKEKVNKINCLEFVDNVLSSDMFGYMKPNKEFFDGIKEIYKEYNDNDFIIIGDSLKSDIGFGINCGIDSIWFDRNEEDLIEIYKPNFIIKNLSELKDLL